MPFKQPKQHGIDIYFKASWGTVEVQLEKKEVGRVCAILRYQLRGGLQKLTVSAVPLTPKKKTTPKSAKIPKCSCPRRYWTLLLPSFSPPFQLRQPSLRASALPVYETWFGLDVAEWVILRKLCGIAASKANIYACTRVHSLATLLCSDVGTVVWLSCWRRTLLL